MDEEQKELIKAGADAAMKPFANLIEKLFGGSVEEIGGMWQDSLKVRRLQRQLKLFAKVQKLIADAGFEPRHVPDTISIPLLLATSLEDDERLQEKWAALLANAANPNVGLHPGFVQILENLAPLDVGVLDEVYKRFDTQYRVKGNIQVVLLEHQDINEVLRAVKESGGQASLENVTRLGLILAVVDETATHPKMKPVYRYHMTELGREFYLACQPPVSRQSFFQGPVTRS
jgi:hypothetical protein